MKGNTVCVETHHYTVSKTPLWNTVTSKCRIPWLPVTMVTVHSESNGRSGLVWLAQVTNSQLATTTNRPRSVPRPTYVIRDWSACPQPVGSDKPTDSDRRPVDDHVVGRQLSLTAAHRLRLCRSAAQPVAGSSAVVRHYCADQPQLRDQNV